MTCDPAQVDRVDGNLFAHRTCQQYWSANGKCQQFASSTTCDGEAIPDSWLATEVRRSPHSVLRVDIASRACSFAAGGLPFSSYRLHNRVRWIRCA